jgi:hypothetical protein
VAVSGLPNEQRIQPRQAIATSGSNPLIATVGVLPRAALVCDISPSGLGLLTTFAPPVGALLPVWLPGPPGQPSHLILAAVVHVQPPSGDDLYHIGVACHDDSARGVLAELLARLGAQEPGNTNQEPAGPGT